MTEQIIQTAFAALTNENRFCAWKYVKRDGKSTKLPVCDPLVGKSNDPASWMSFTAAIELSKLGRNEGLGVFLGPLLRDPDKLLIGLDLDTCIDPTVGTRVPWAEELLEATPGYWETSPSGTGLKGFALARRCDLEAFSSVLNGTLTKTWKKPGSEREHPPCIDLYAGGRFFTITGQRINESEESLPFLTREQIGQIINKFGPKLSCKSNTVRKLPPRSRANKSSKPDPKVNDGEPDASIVQGSLERMRDWAASDDMLPYRNAFQLLSSGATDHLGDPSRSGQEFAFARVARLSGLDEPAFEEAIKAWTAAGFGYGEGDGDQRPDSERARSWKRCWENNAGTELPVFIADRERNALFIQKKRDSDRYYEKLSSYIKPIYELIDDAGEYYRCFEVGTRVDRFKEVTIPCKAWSGRRDDFLDILTKEGLFHASFQSARSNLRAWVNSGKPPSAVLATRTGWVDHTAFALPENVICADGCPQVVERIPANDGFGSRGALEDWQQSVAQYCAGNSRLIITLCAAFLGPLMKWTGVENGGIHINGPSSIGKSTALRVCASVYGPNAFMKTWRATDNGLESVAESRSDTCLLLDELSEAAPGAADRIAYMLANGRGKDRANRDGSSRPAKKWRIIFVSSGEISLADKLRETGKRATAGQQIRVLDIEADPGMGFGLFDTIHGHQSASLFAEELSKALSENYGMAGPAFIKEVIERREEVLRWFESARAEFCQNHYDHSDVGQVRRGLNRFAALAAAGEVAIKLKILPWQKGEAIWGVSRCLEDWIENRGYIGPVEDQRYIEVLRQLIQTRGDLVFQPLDTEFDLSQFKSERVGFFKTEADGSTIFYILPEAWKNLFQREGLNPGAAAKTLGIMGYLRRGDGKRWQTKLDLRAHRLSQNSRVYAMSSSILDDK